jgi:hypothetical protein
MVRSRHWIKSKNPQHPAVKREAEEGHHRRPTAKARVASAFASAVPAFPAVHDTKS